MARGQGFGEGLENLGAGLAPLVHVLDPVFRDVLEGGVEHLLVVGAEG